MAQIKHIGQLQKDFVWNHLTEFFSCDRNEFNCLWGYYKAT